MLGARIPALLVSACFSTLFLSAQAAPDLPRANFDIVTVNNRADLVSGGNAMVEVSVPNTVPLHQVTLLLNGQDVTSSFKSDAAARTMRGVLTGLRVGDNEFVADANGRGRGRPKAALTITNHGIGGPILSGAQITPYVCATPTAQPVSPTNPVATNASGLSTFAVDAQCNIANEFKLWYRTTATPCSLTLPDANNPPSNPCFKRYVVGDPTPADLANVPGTVRPYIVRVERGTMNRGIYDIAVLFDPTQPWTPLAPQAQWSGKVLYQFGASTGQPRRQSRSSSNWTSAELALTNGYLIAQNSMTDSALNSNRVSMAETVMMMKEHIGDTYGSIKFTMGTGCSGGSINSNMNASIAPGQLDGITISCAYPDSETTGIEVTECVLLAEAYQKPAWLNLMSATGQTQAQINAKKTAINGHVDHTGCHGWYNAFGSNGKAGVYVQRFVTNNVTGAIAAPGQPTNNCQLPNSMVYSPENPTGERCSAWDWAASIWGKDQDGRALNTRDNAGVQYGLKALQAGSITAEEFVTLNEIIGGIDDDANFQSARSVADAAALETAYRAGIVMSGRQLAKTAVIDMRGWDDSALITLPGAVNPPGAPIHYVWRSFSIRDRLDKQFGDHGNQVMWRFGRTSFVPSAALGGEAFGAMDLWLTNLKADTGGASIEAKVRTAKPATAFDFCLLPDEPAQTTKVTDAAICNDKVKYPSLQPHSSPRQVAGGPLTEDILKCRLKPLNAADYAPAVLSPEQLARLQAVFPTGVCDWAAGGVGQQPAISPMDFSGGPGGAPLPPAPRSQPRP